jgi:rhamnosyltransferase
MKVAEEKPVKLCSVTVLYNPHDTVFDYLSSYLAKVQRAFIIDNSDVTADLGAALMERFGSHKISYTRNNANTGIAAALNKGFSLALAEGYNWVLTMDQDSYFDSHRFFDLAMPMMQRNNIAIIGASYSSKVPFKSHYSAEFDRMLFVVTSGNLVNIDSWQQVGGFDEKLFIDEVDNDFCLRLNRRKWLVLSSVEILLRHSLGISFSIQASLFR